MRPILIIISMLIAITSLFAAQITVSGYQNDFRITSGTNNNMELEFTLGSFYSNPISINGSEWHTVSLPKEAISLEAGFPELPIVSRSVIIPATAAMQLSTLSSEYVDIQMQVAPSKGNLTRNINPESVAYSFADVYESNEAYPEQITSLTEPFILRDYRGITIRVNPFQYFPATGTLRVYTKLSLSLQVNGTDLNNAISSSKSSYARSFESIYQNMFLNFGDAKYPSLGEEGSILVIKHSMFDATLQPWVDWKRQIGFDVTVVDVTTTGASANQIKTYIQNFYNADNNLMFVQIFGDAPQVPSLSSGGGGSDPSYALLAGSDNYPDIFVGRFSASNVNDMQTQVQRSIYYERDIQVGADYLAKAMGIASSEGGGGQGDNNESDIQHMNLIRTDLLNYGYTSVDQVYDPSASAATVSTNLNAGRGFINYVGHGSDTSWVTTGFSNSHVNNLTNSNMLPFIVSVACVNGNFVSQTCFAEAWMRATHNTTGAPTGAIAIYASTVNQGWNPPMRGQDEITDLLIAESKHRIGSLYFNGSSKMIEAYGTSGVSEYKNWTIFGDASLMVRTQNPSLMNASYNPVLLMGVSNFSIQTEPNAYITLSNAGTIYGKAVANATGNASITLNPAPAEPMNLTLTVVAFNKQTLIQTIQVLPNDGPYLMLDSISISDDNDSIPQYGELVQLSLNVNNIGSEAANNVSVSLSTSDSNVTIVNPMFSIPTVDANGGGLFGNIPIQISSSIPDQHEVIINVHMQEENGDTFDFERSFVVNAPQISWGTIEIDDTDGNNNGRVDAGESIVFTLNLSNTGHADATDISSTILINGVDHYYVEPVLPEIASVPVGFQEMLIYRVSFSSQIPTGTQIQITAMAFHGDYLAMNSYSLTLGLELENFEAGFSSMPWTFQGGTWLDTQSSYNGSMAAKSPAINHGTNTSMSITKNIQNAGSLSFWKKVSSEATYDKLTFHINGLLMGEWSGTSDSWSQVSYPVQAGLNIFTWKYTKDGGGSVGSDCAWIDDIIFPSTNEILGDPILSVSTENINFGDVPANNSISQTITITNSGTAAMMGVVNSTAPFYLGENPAQNSLTESYYLPAGETMEMMVTFAPTYANNYSANITISSDDPNMPEAIVPVLGTSGTVSNQDLVNPLVTALHGNYPNPFNPNTNIKFSLKENSPVQLDIYNISGQKVRTLLNANMAAGNHIVTWNGLDNSGRSVGSGVYFFKMNSGKYTSTKKMILMK